MGSIEVSLSVTELPHFERLVDFVVEVACYAEHHDDPLLGALVDECREDLARLAEEER